jgi:hypothetical protein
MWRRLSLVFFLALASLSPLAGAGAAPASAPDTPAAGVVGDGNPGSCDETALTEALAGGGAVTFDCGGPKMILILNAQVITQSTTIDGGGIITITGGLATRLFEVHEGASLALRDIALDSGNSAGGAGGAIHNVGALTLERTIIQYSQTSIANNGGAIYAAGPVTIDNSQLTHNSAGNGGALFVVGPDARVEIVDSLIDNNHALKTTGNGGAIHVGSLSEVIIRDSSLFNNDALGDGGAIYNTGRLTSDHTDYITNQTTLDPNASFRGYGGAIASRGTLTMTGGTVYGNASRFGGGLYIGQALSPTVSQLSGSTLILNQALYAGGGLYTSADSTTVLTVTDTMFGGNRADVGGGLSRTNTPLSIFRSSFGLNEARIGGGLANAGLGLAPTVLVHDSTFYSNVVTATQGGGILNSGFIELRNVTLEGNTNGVSNMGAGESMHLANTVLHNQGLNCDGDGTKPQTGGYNFASDLTCSLTQDGDVEGAGLDPLLGPLEALSSTPTQFFIPLPGSPLINTVGAYCSPRDQRGALRPDACDKGAIEYRGMLPRVFVPLVRRNP